MVGFRMTATDFLSSSASPIGDRTTVPWCPGIFGATGRAKMSVEAGTTDVPSEVLSPIELDS